jgi:hypothetical protein
MFAKGGMMYVLLSKKVYLAGCYYGTGEIEIFTLHF